MKRFIPFLTCLLLITFAPLASLSENLDWSSPAVWVKSAGNRDFKRATRIDSSLLGTVLHVEESVGGWFSFVIPKDGDYHFSIKAPNLSQMYFTMEFFIGDDKTYLDSLLFIKSNTIQTRVLKDLKAGSTIYWYDRDASGNGYTQLDPYELRITIESSDYSSQYTIPAQQMPQTSSVTTQSSNTITDSKLSASLTQQLITRSGPGTMYTQELGTQPADTEIFVVSQVEANGAVWYQVEYTLDQKMYRCYTGKKRVNVYGDIPWESNNYVEDTLTSNADAYYGPGTNYAKHKNGVAKGMVVRVFTVEGLWAQCEYKVGNQLCRCYISVDKLANTIPSATPTVVPTTPMPANHIASNILDPVAKLCIDYYGNLFNYTGHSEEFAEIAGVLPVMNYVDGVPCIYSQIPVFSGPGEHYWCLHDSSSNYAYIEKNDTTLRIYGRENDWIMIRCFDDANGGYRYGWITLNAILNMYQNHVQNVDFADITLLTTSNVNITDAPDRTLQKNSPIIAEHISAKVKGLAFLDEKRNWVYCEFTLYRDGKNYVARGFIPSDNLRLE